MATKTLVPVNMANIPAAPDCLIAGGKDLGSSKHGNTPATSECLIDVGKDLGSTKYGSILPTPEC